MTSETRYYLITHRTTGVKYKAESTSKSLIKRDLPRFNEQSGYGSYFDIDQITGTQWFKNRHLPDVIHAVA